MKLEILLNAIILIIFISLVFHAFIKRKKEIAILCLCMGLGFGVLFPFIHINIFRSYSFYFRYEILGLPLFLSLFWFCAFYIPLWVSERIANIRGNPVYRPISSAVAAGLVMLAMEIIWDDLAIRGGILSFQGVSYLWNYPGFHSGIALQINAAHFIFAYVYVYTIEQLKAYPKSTSLGRMLITGTLMMISLFLVGLYFIILRFPIFNIQLDPTIALIADAVISLATIAICILQTSWLFAMLRRAVTCEA